MKMSYISADQRRLAVKESLSKIFRVHKSVPPIQARLKEQSIPNMVYYAKPLHLQPVFAHLGYNAGDFPVTEDCASRVLSLPMHGYMGQEEVVRIGKVLTD